jgi:hypothetical protein
VQVVVALILDRGYDPGAFRAFLIGALFPVAFWTINGAAALHSQTVGLFSGPRGERVVWDIPRERLESE